MGELIDMERKGYESIGGWTHHVTLWFGLSRSNLEIAVSQELDGHLTWNRRDLRLYRMLDPLHDFDLWFHPWPWTWIFKVKFSNSHISGMGGSINMERKGCESDTIMLDPLYNLELCPHPGLKFSRSNFEIVIFQEWMDRLIWNKWDMNWEWWFAFVTSPMTLDFQG